MRKSRFTEEQILAILAEGDAGISGTDLARRHGIRRQTLSCWKANYGGLQVTEARRLRQLEDENRRLKKLVADLALANAMLTDGVGRKW